MNTGDESDEKVIKFATLFNQLNQPFFQTDQVKTLRTSKRGAVSK
jgi:hypothetical protein